MLGVLAALVGIADTIPYVRDTLRGGDPAAPRDVADLERAGGSLVCLSQRADGASWSLLMAAAQPSSPASSSSSRSGAARAA